MHPASTSTPAALPTQLTRGARLFTSRTHKGKSADCPCSPYPTCPVLCAYAGLMHASHRGRTVANLASHLLAAHKLRPPARKGVRACKGQLECAPHQEAAEDSPAHIPHLHSTKPMVWCALPDKQNTYAFRDQLEMSACDWDARRCTMSAIRVVTHQNRQLDSHPWYGQSGSTCSLQMEALCMAVMHTRENQVILVTREHLPPG